MAEPKKLLSVGDGKKERILFKQGTRRRCLVPVWGYEEVERNDCGHEDCEVYDGNRG